MDVLKRMARAGIVPVVVLDDAKDAVPTAKAMVAGGIDVMEITFLPIPSEPLPPRSPTCCPAPEPW